MAANKIFIGISRCLLGDSVRYDGSHKRHAYIVNELAQIFALSPICPEVAIGLSVPREPIRLIAVQNGLPRAVSVAHATGDVTARLETLGLNSDKNGFSGWCGFIFKSKSPSCGLGQVTVYNHSGEVLHQHGQGVYARAMLNSMPLLPAVDEVTLDIPSIRDNFIQRVLAYHRSQFG